MYLHGAHVVSWKDPAGKVGCESAAVAETGCHHTLFSRSSRVVRARSSCVAPDSKPYALPLCYVCCYVLSARSGHLVLQQGGGVQAAKGHQVCVCVLCSHSTVVVRPGARLGWRVVKHTHMAEQCYTQACAAIANSSKSQPSVEPHFVLNLQLAPNQTGQSSPLLLLQGRCAGVLPAVWSVGAAGSARLCSQQRLQPVGGDRRQRCAGRQGRERDRGGKPI